MAGYIQVISLVFVGILLLWIGYSLFFGIGTGKTSGTYNGKGQSYQFLARQGHQGPEESYAGAPQTCPVCSAKLREGELVSSAAFPSFNGGKDRLMHIKGCIYCLSGERDRICPVCGQILNTDEILVSRMFERTLRRSHVHVLGCSRCRKGKI